jgi:hypothetical protein
MEEKEGILLAPLLLVELKQTAAREASEGFLEVSRDILMPEVPGPVYIIGHAAVALAVCHFVSPPPRTEDTLNIA